LNRAAVLQRRRIGNRQLRLIPQWVKAEERAEKDTTEMIASSAGNAATAAVPITPGDLDAFSESIQEIEAFGNCDITTSQRIPLLPFG